MTGILASELRQATAAYVEDTATCAAAIDQCGVSNRLLRTAIDAQQFGTDQIGEVEKCSEREGAETYQSPAGLAIRVALPIAFWKAAPGQTSVKTSVSPSFAGIGGQRAARPIGETCRWLLGDAPGQRHEGVFECLSLSREFHHGKAVLDHRS